MMMATTAEENVEGLSGSSVAKTGSCWECRDNLLITSCDDGIINIWNGFTYELLVSLSGEHFEQIECIALSQDNNKLASTDGTGIIVWDLQTLSSIAVSPFYVVWALCFNTAGDKLAGSCDRHLRVWDLNANDRVIWEMNNHITLTPNILKIDKQFIVTRTTSHGCECDLSWFDCDTGEFSRKLKPFVFSQYTFSPTKENEIAVCRVNMSDRPHPFLSPIDPRDTKLMIWDIVEREIKVETVIRELAECRSISYDNSGSHLFIASKDGVIRRWCIETGAVTICVTTEARVHNVAFSPDRTKFALIGSGDCLVVDESGSVLANLGKQSGHGISWSHPQMVVLM
jgi:WD40 repeat protein